MKSNATIEKIVQQGSDPVSGKRRSCRFLNECAGSVLMEYLLVQILVACLLMVVMNALFYNWGTATFGPGGMAIKYFYQRLLGGLSLPVP